jgi:hypothetical protein
MRAALGLTILALAGGAAGVAQAGPVGHSCGVVAGSYTVRIVAGDVTCAAARSALRRFLAGGTQARGWICFRGHASQHQAWAAACATAGGALVRAYPR